MVYSQRGIDNVDDACAVHMSDGVMRGAGCGNVGSGGGTV